MLAITCTESMVIASAWAGLTLPGMIDEPGSLTGIVNSASPARGPHESSRMSLPTRYGVTASVRIAVERCTSASCPPCTQNLFGALTKRQVV